MQDYVHLLRHAAPFINAHRERTFVIMLPGEAIAHENFIPILHDLVLLHSLGVRLVLVHGSRPQIEAKLKANAVTSSYHNQLRITDRQTLDCVIETVGQLRALLEARLSVNITASPMQGARLRVVSGNFVAAKPYGVIDGVDFQHTGEVRRIDSNSIRSLLEQRQIVLLSHLGYSPTGEIFNLGCEEVATQAAAALQADKLIMFHSDNGLLDNTGELIRELDINQAKQQLVQLGGQLKQPLLHSAITACEAGVNRSHVIGYANNGSLLTELFTRDGCGTMVDHGQFEKIRQANVEDISSLLALIGPLEEQGILVRRSRDMLEREYNRFTLIERDGLVIACAALYVFAEDHSAELACLAVHPQYRHGGRGDTLLEQIEQQARQLGLKSLFVLTTRTADWFQERGFLPCTIDQLPDQKASLYNFQRNSKVFIKTL